MKISSPLNIVVGVVVIAALIFIFQTMQPSHQKTLTVGERTYTLEVAADNDARAKGLGERDSLCDTCAMLFVFDAPGRYGFWMKGMSFPIDIIWLADNRIVHIERNIPADSQEIYQPSVPANRVLEVNANQSADWNVGDEVRFP